MSRFAAVLLAFGFCASGFAKDDFNLFFGNTSPERAKLLIYCGFRSNDDVRDFLVTQNTLHRGDRVLKDIHVKISPMPGFEVETIEDARHYQEIEKLEAAYDRNPEPAAKESLKFAQATNQTRVIEFLKSALSKIGPNKVVLLVQRCDSLYDDDSGYGSRLFIQRFLKTTPHSALGNYGYRSKSAVELITLQLPDGTTEPILAEHVEGSEVGQRATVIQNPIVHQAGTKLEIGRRYRVVRYSYLPRFNPLD